MNYRSLNHRDKNHSSITDELRRQGVEVIDILQPLDTLCRLHDFVAFIEFKVPGSDACYTRKQLQFIAGTQMPVAVATDATQAMRFLKTQEGLTQANKDRLAGHLLKTTKQKFTPKEIETLWK
jgi:hypothetical protein